MILDLILIGLAVTLDPLPLTAFMIVLPSRRGVRKGAALRGQHDHECGQRQRVERDRQADQD